MGLGEYINKSKDLVSDSSLKKCKIALLSNFTINGLGEIIKVLCNENRIYAEIYTPGYNQYAQEILDKSSQFHKYNPDMVFLLLDAGSFLGEMYDFPYRLDNTKRKEKIENKFQELKEIIFFLEQNANAKIVINNFSIPPYSSRGILENKQDYGLRDSIKDLNNLLENLARKDSRLFVFDFNLFIMKQGYDKVRDSKMDYLADMKISPNSLVSLAEEYLAYVFPLMSMTKKCIVLDLDNTLWGGIIGEDGIANIHLGPEKEGKPFLNFQKKLLELSERGIILAINSKNNFDDAINVLRNHPYMLLKEDNFASIRINWNNKLTNIQEIAKELNIGMDSLVFIDDDKTNREMVRKMLPEIFVPELPEDPCDYVKVLETIKFFSSFSITKEDVEKQEMYAAQRKRNELRSGFSDLESFLKELKIEIGIMKVNNFSIPRASQLSQKTNQFNLTTRRYSEEDIKSFLDNKDYILRLVHVKDRFGDYGITGMAVLRKIDAQTVDIDTFLLSCRILGKDIEFAFLQELINEAEQHNIQKITAKFVSTIKNAPAANFLNEAGFTLKEEYGKEKHYVLDIGKENKKQFYAEIKHVNT